MSKKSIAKDYAHLDPITKLANYTYIFVLELRDFAKETFEVFLKIQIRIFTSFLAPLALAFLTVFLGDVCSVVIFGYMSNPGLIAAGATVLLVGLFWLSAIIFSFSLYASEFHPSDEFVPPYFRLATVFFPASLNDTLILVWHLTYLIPATTILVWILGKVFRLPMFSAGFGYFSVSGALIFIALFVHGARKPARMYKTAGA